MRIHLGPLTALVAGEARIVPFPAGTPPRRSVLVVKDGAGAPRAYWNVCRHLPVPLDGGTGELPVGPLLVCGTHGAFYRPSDGLCVEGPCEGESLEPIAVVVEADEVWGVF